MSMKIILNGKGRELKNGFTVDRLLKELDLDARLVAVEINENIVRRDNYSSSRLHENDKVEIVHFVGGGIA